MRVKQSLREPWRPPDKAGRKRDEDTKDNTARRAGEYQQPGDNIGDHQEDWAEGKTQQLAQKLPAR